MTHAELNREWQLERANLIAHLAACRRMLATCQGMLSANRMLAKAGVCGFTDVEKRLLESIEAYEKVGMFETLPEEIAR